MILGVGIDLVDISRIEALMVKHPGRFLARVFTPEEIEYCTKRHDAATCLAGRFAAKEATYKALAVGRHSGIGFKDIRVRVLRGTPELELTGSARSRAMDLGAVRMLLSISHEKGCAVAVVILEGQ